MRTFRDFYEFYRRPNLTYFNNVCVVSDIEKSRRLFESLLNIHLNTDHQERFSLHQAGYAIWFEPRQYKSQTDPYGNSYYGLKQIALDVPTMAELHRVMQRLELQGINYSGLQWHNGQTAYINFVNDDGIYIEFFVNEDVLR